MAVDFKQLLTKPLDEVKRPTALPTGTYFGTISKFAFGESRFEDKDTHEKNAEVKFTLVGIRAGEDVDQGLLEPCEAETPLAKRSMQTELPITGGKEWITKAFMEGLGIDCTGRSWGDTIPETLNQEVMFQITQRMDKVDNTILYNDVRNLRAVPAA